MEEEDNIIVKWAQEDVQTLYKLLNNNNMQHKICKTISLKQEIKLNEFN